MKLLKKIKLDSSYGAMVQRAVNYVLDDEKAFKVFLQDGRVEMISYELSIGLSILTVVVLAGTMSITGLVQAQADGWFLFKGHIPALIAFVIYLIAATAETNRGPFDLPEAEHELTAGYHTEYSGIHFGGRLRADRPADRGGGCVVCLCYPDGRGYRGCHQLLR